MKLYNERFKNLFYEILKDIRVDDPGIMKERSLFAVLEEFLDTVYEEGRQRGKYEELLSRGKNLGKNLFQDPNK